MLKRSGVVLLVVCFALSTMAKVKYSLSFDDVHTHYVTVDIATPTQGEDFIDFKVPVWTPGSYKVRDYSKAFENVRAKDMEVSRIDKNTWRVFTKGKKKMHLTYDVYCFTVSVRQSYADINYAYLHGVSAFGYLENYQEKEIALKINLRSNWKQIEVALPLAGEQLYHCENYDLLADSPIALGNFDASNYSSGGVDHRIVMIGEGNYDLTTVTADFKAISDYQVNLMGGHPSPQYVHFVYNVGSGGGGLEHQNSQCSMINRWAYSDAAAYRRFLGLIAHEYFHLWNVKRIRPVTLGPFDYNKENYTDMLWIAEGITSYIDDRTLYSIGKYSETEYIRIVESQINRLENTPGKHVMTLAESSRLAWVKSYMPSEESVNTEVSYYNKGMVAALLLDLEIRKHSGKSIEDVLKQLYKKYYIKKERGFTHREFIEVCNKVANHNLNDFFESVVFSTQPLDYAKTFDAYGFTLVDENAKKNIAWSGISSKQDNGKVVVTQLLANSPGVEAELSVNDELLGVNGWRLDKPFEQWEEDRQVGESVMVLYSRDGKLYSAGLILQRNPKLTYRLERSEDKNALSEQWLAR